MTFEMLGIPWHYEPIELGTPPDGYIPDFILDCSLYAGPDRPPAGPVLVEVRPHLVAAEYRPSIDRIARSGWTGPAVVLGAVIRRREFWSESEWWCGYGHPAVDARHAVAGSDEWFQVGWSGPESIEAPSMFAMGGEYDLSKEWREAGNRSRWKPSR